MDSVGQILHPECQDGGQPGKGNGGGKEGVAEPGKNQKYWTPEASSLGAVCLLSTPGLLFTLHSQLGL